jgi:hypothetical protein
MWRVGHVVNPPSQLELVVAKADASVLGPLVLSQATYASASSSGSSPMSTNPEPASPKTLHQLASTGGARKLSPLLVVFTALWNGGLGIAYVSLPEDGEAGAGLHLVMFALVGLCLIAVTTHQFLASRGCRPRLFTSALAVAPGDSTELKWSIEGSVTRLRRLTISLEGVEETILSDDETRTTVLSSTNVVDECEFAKMVAGATRLRIPEYAIPSSMSEHKKIVWVLHVRGDISHWPDLDEEFIIVVGALYRPALVCGR